MLRYIGLSPPNGLLLSGFETKSLYVVFIFTIFTYIIFLDVVLVMFDEEYK